MPRASKFEVFGGLALLAIYTAAYFFLVRPVAGLYVARANRLENSPGYGPVPAELFAPIHWLDRKAFRPKMWSFPGTQNEYDHYMGWDR
jgi:hypothetical protein